MARILTPPALSVQKFSAFLPSLPGNLKLFRMDFRQYSQIWAALEAISLGMSNKLHKLGKTSCISVFFALKYPVEKKDDSMLNIVLVEP